MSQLMRVYSLHSLRSHSSQPITGSLQTSPPQPALAALPEHREGTTWDWFLTQATSHYNYLVSVITLVILSPVILNYKSPVLLVLMSWWWSPDVGALTAQVCSPRLSQHNWQADWAQHWPARPVTSSGAQSVHHQDHPVIILRQCLVWLPVTGE